MKPPVGSLVILAVLAASFVVMAVSAVGGWAVPYAVAALVGYAIEWWIARRRRLDHALRRARFSVTVRFAVRDTLLVLLAVMVTADTGVRTPAFVAAVTWAVGGQLLRVAYMTLAQAVTARTRGPVTWLNLEIPGLRPPRQPLRLLATGAGPRIRFAGALPTAGVVAAALGASGGTVWLLTALALAIAAVSVIAALVDRLAVRTYADSEEVAGALREALAGYAPEVVAYLSGGRGSTFALKQWLATLEQSTPRCLVIVREAHHLSRLSDTTLPVLCLPRAVDVEEFVTPSVKVALYPLNGTRNAHLLRQPGIADVFVGHGDSDKGSSVNPYSRVYDEVWVAGRAGRDRYRQASVGVRDEQVREVGRPQLAGIVRADPGRDPHRPFTVLYAPTWEGFYAALAYSSLQRMGRTLIAQLLATEGVRVLFKPHPTTGTRDREYARASTDITKMIARAGGRHAVVDGAGLYDAFNEADLLISDISSVVSDFLYSRKPYIITNPHDEDEDEFRRTYPSSAGAHLLDSSCGRLAEFVADVRGPDVLRHQREETARYLLGDETGDPVAVFDHALMDLVRRWSERGLVTTEAGGTA